jgi:hypothetical protein
MWLIFVVKLFGKGSVLPSQSKEVHVEKCKTHLTSTLMLAKVTITITRVPLCIHRFLSRGFKRILNV